MRKEKLYLDTSVISYLDQQDIPEKMKETQQFWNFLKLGIYEVMISNIAIDEVKVCSIEKRNQLFKYIESIEFINIEETKESIILAKEYLKQAVLTEKSFVDCRHIALASVYECDYIVSWNFKHMANVQTMKKVQGVNILEGYKTIGIYPPTEFLYEER